MKGVDVVTAIDIDRSREDVAQYAADPSNAPEWYVNIKTMRWHTPESRVKVGGKADFVAHFLGRRIAYTYEITEFEPGERLTMRTASGPFPMQTEYSWSDLPRGRTRMTLRNSGTPSGFGRLSAPLMSMAMRRANRKDLKRLKEIMEARQIDPPTVGN